MKSNTVLRIPPQAVLYTSGHMAYWSFEECARRGVYMLWDTKAGTRKICHYPGRDLKPREYELVMLKFFEMGTLKSWQLKAIISLVEDEERARAFAQALAT